MRASVTIDDDLLRTAHEYTGVTERAELIREALKSLIAGSGAQAFGTGRNCSEY